VSNQTGGKVELHAGAIQGATDAAVRPRSLHAEWPQPTREPVQSGRFFALFLIAFCLGVVLTLAWQSYGDATRETIAQLSPRLSWVAPSATPAGQPNPAAPSAEQEELKTLSDGLAEVRQRIDEIAAQIPVVQEQMRRDISNKLEAVEQEIFDKVSAPPPRPAAAQPRKPAPER
jgi:uncharacterized coiled-coil protein SlyX